MDDPNIPINQAANTTEHTMRSTPTSTKASMSTRAYRVIAPIVLCLSILAGTAGRSAQAEPVGGSRSAECVALAREINAFEKLLAVGVALSEKTPQNDDDVTTAYVLGMNLKIEAMVILMKLEKRFGELGCDPGLLEMYGRYF
jgi:hypothetical protein